MPLFVIPFPYIDPVLIHLGPFPIRWYALAYIGGILLGWAYARALIRNERLWGGPAPLKVIDFDDFVLWVTLGIILGGRAGYVLFYLDLTPQYVFGSTPFYWGVYALGIAPVLLGLASFFVGKTRLAPWRPLLIGLPLGFVGTLGVYYTIAASI